MVLIIKACKVILLFHKHLNSKNPSVFYPFPCFRQKNVHNIGAIHCSILFYIVSCSSRDSASGSKYDYVIVNMADCSLQSTEVFLKNQHVSFIGPYHPTSIQQGKSLYVLVGYFILIPKKYMKCVLRMGSSQRSPQIMRAWEIMRNFNMQV